MVQRSSMHELGMPPGYGDLARGRRKANRIIRVPSVGTLAAGVTAAPQTIRFLRPGEVIAIYGQTKEATDSAAADSSVRIQIGGDRELVTDGSGGAFAPFFALFGTARNWWPLGIEVAQQEIWTLYLRNEAAAATRTPDLLLAVWEEG